MDVFITLLSLGINGYKNLISQRKAMYTYLKDELGRVASKHGEKILETNNNPISMGKLKQTSGQVLEFIKFIMWNVNYLF